MQKFFLITTVINGIPMMTEKLGNTLYYSIGEAEFHIKEWFENGDKNKYIILPTYRNAEADKYYNETRDRITKKYREM